MCTKQPHKHAELIKAWADGAAIQWRNPYGDVWENIKTPSWLDKFDYRVKPEPKSDIVRYGTLDLIGNIVQIRYNYFSPNAHTCDNLKVVFDGETLELKEVSIV